jgi:hypothetical protein
MAAEFPRFLVVGAYPDYGDKKGMPWVQPVMAETAAGAEEKGRTHQLCELVEKAGEGSTYEFEEQAAEIVADSNVIVFTEAEVAAMFPPRVPSDG